MKTSINETLIAFKEKHVSSCKRILLTSCPSYSRGDNISTTHCLNNQQISI